MDGSRYHLCADKVGLIVSTVEGWPDSGAGLTDDDGNPFPTVYDAVAAMVAVSTPFIPMGCPTPDAKGRCPGHPVGGDS